MKRRKPSKPARPAPASLPSAFSRALDAFAFDCIRSVPRLTPWEWTCANVNYSLSSGYESALKGPYDPQFMPFWEVPMNCVADTSTRVVVVLGGSRMGKTENMILNPMRWAVSAGMGPLLYASAQQESTEDFFLERIKTGFEVSDDTARRYALAFKRGMSIDYGNGCRLTGTWAGSTTGFKQRGALIGFGDEVSSWDDVASIDMLYKRGATFRGAKTIVVSAPDAKQKRSSDDDPIFKMYEAGTCEWWMMPDPAGGELFRFVMGGKDTAYGLKWDHAAKNADGGWDLKRVAETAHYMTPGGARIETADKMALIRKGKWIATNPKAIPGHRSFHLPEFYSPFPTGDFGDLAVRFLSAAASGQSSLRMYRYETEAERWHDEVSTTTDEQLMARRAPYQRGQHPDEAPDTKTIYIGKPSHTYLTCDVQQSHMLWTIRKWFRGGDSGLIDWGSSALWDDIDARAKLAKVGQIYVDNSYEKRQVEVYEECFMRRMIPTYGRAQIMQPWARREIDPFEGKKGQGRYKLVTITFNPDMFKDLAYELVKGSDSRVWMVPSDIDRTYSNQMLSEERGPAGWRLRRGFTQNHLWDCEVLQVLAATINGMHRG